MSLVTNVASARPIVNRSTNNPTRIAIGTAAAVSTYAAPNALPRFESAIRLAANPSHSVALTIATISTGRLERRTGSALLAQSPGEQHRNANRQHDPAHPQAHPRHRGRAGS